MLTVPALLVRQTETLSLASNSLVGSIPSLANLTELANLYLYRNQLSGQLPSGLFDLNKLGEFNKLHDMLQDSPCPY